MKNLVLGALLAAAASSAACSSSPTASNITVHWSFSSYANRLSTANDPCPLQGGHDFNTTTVHALPWDPVAGATISGARPIEDKFTCDDYSGTTGGLDGIYEVYVTFDTQELTNPTTYATSESVILDTADGHTSLTVPTIYTDAAFFGATWDLIRGSNSARISCSAAGVDTVSLTGASTTIMSMSNPFPCDDGFGISDLFPNGDYTLTLTASLGMTDKGASGPIDGTINAPDSTELDHENIPVQ